MRSFEGTSSTKKEIEEIKNTDSGHMVQNLASIPDTPLAKRNNDGRIQTMGLLRDYSMKNSMDQANLEMQRKKSNSLSAIQET